MSNVTFEHLEWDSRYFGLRIARLKASHLEYASLIEALRECDAGQVDCVYFLAESDDALTASLAQANGFLLTDVRMMFERLSTVNEVDPADATSTLIRPAQPADLPILRAIARVSHTDTRFYYDHNFARERCDALYETWIENSYTGFAKAVFVAERNHNTCGYVTCHLVGEGAQREAQLGLIAVAENQRGTGLGKALVNAFITWAGQQGASRMTVVTQGRNIRAQRLYQQRGFLTASLQLWFHRWRSASLDDLRTV